MRSGLLPIWLAPPAYWTFDEFVRWFTLAYVSGGQPISIELALMNRQF